MLSKTKHITWRRWIEQKEKKKENNEIDLLELVMVLSTCVSLKTSMQNKEN